MRRERQRAGITQEALAELADVSPRMVQKIEHGDSNLLFTTAMRIRTALGCRLDDLAPGFPDKRPAARRSGRKK